MSGRSLYPCPCPWRPGWPGSSRASCASPIPAARTFTRCGPSLTRASGPSPWPPPSSSPAATSGSARSARPWRTSPMSPGRGGRGRGGRSGGGHLRRRPLSKAHEAHPQPQAGQKVPLIDCFSAPCRSGCPIEQDIPAYLMKVGEGKLRGGAAHHHPAQRPALHHRHHLLPPLPGQVHAQRLRRERLHPRPEVEGRRGAGLRPCCPSCAPPPPPRAGGWPWWAAAPAACPPPTS